MRIVRLQLERYGHVSGECLEFPADTGLHVVIGANEAGKSTALKALADGLFGFRLRSRDNHPDDPRIGFTLRAHDGTEASFVRRKSGRDKLLDAAGLPMPEAALARFLGGTGRDRFLDVFGLDAERLRRAGRTIMAEEGEAGATILQAQTGLRGLRETVDHLDGEAKLLFGDGRGVRRISAAAGAIKENRRLMADRSLSGPDYLALVERETELDQQLGAITQERQALRQEQARLDRIRRTAPFRTELAELAAQRAALGPAIPLPPDAVALFADAVEQQARSADAAAREQAEIDALDAALATLTPDPAALAVADALRSLDADRTRVAEIRRDLLTVSGQAVASLRTIDSVARDLGIAERGIHLRARIPDLTTRRAAERLLTDYQKRTGARAVAATALLSAEQARDAEASILAAMPPVPDADALRDAVEAARNAGLIDDEIRDAAPRLDAVTAERDRRLARLVGWDAGSDALERSRIPLESDAARLGTALEAAEREHRDADAARVRHEAAIEAARVALAGIEAAGALPTRESLQAVRQRRDGTWRELRRALEAGLPPGELPDTFERRLHEADVVADARQTELTRIRDWEQRRQQAAELTAARPGLAAAAEHARASHGAAEAAWRAAWAPAGVTPSAPPAMREWVRDREDAIAAIAVARVATQALTLLSQRRASLRAALCAFLSDQDGDHLAPPLQQAARLVQSIDQRIAAVVRAGKAEDALAKARQVLVTMDVSARSWAQEWTPIAHRLALRPDGDPTGTTDLLALWSTLDKALGEWEALQARCVDMSAAISRHDERVAALAAHLALPVTDTLIPEQADRLRRAEHARDETSRSDQARSTRRAARDDMVRAAAEAADALDRLRRQAGTADDDGLQRAITAQATRAALTKQMQDREATLRTQADGKTDAELAEEAAAIDIDTIPGRLETIQHRAEALDAEAKTLTENLLTTRQRLATMRTGQDVTGPAHAIQDAIGDIEDAAHRYVRVRLAHALLRGGIDVYRRSQQGPLLVKASALFGVLTGGRYERLEQDEGDKGEPVIVAVRPDGSTCHTDALSEGTTDQLFLSLRLASIALEAAEAEPLPFVGDDLLVNFDDARATAALRLLSEFGKTTQVILFTHHPHLLALVPPGAASIHQLPRELTA